MDFLCRFHHLLLAAVLFHFCSTHGTPLSLKQSWKQTTAGSTDTVKGGRPLTHKGQSREDGVMHSILLTAALAVVIISDNAPEVFGIFISTFVMAVFALSMLVLIRRKTVLRVVRLASRGGEAAAGAYNLPLPHSVVVEEEKDGYLALTPTSPRNTSHTTHGGAAGPSDSDSARVASPINETTVEPLPPPPSLMAPSPPPLPSPRANTLPPLPRAVDWSSGANTLPPPPRTMAWSSWADTLPPPPRAVDWSSRADTLPPLPRTMAWSSGIITLPPPLHPPPSRDYLHPV